MLTLFPLSHPCWTCFNITAHLRFPPVLVPLVRSRCIRLEGSSWAGKAVRHSQEHLMAVVDQDQPFTLFLRWNDRGVTFDGNQGPDVNLLYGFSECATGALDNNFITCNQICYRQWSQPGGTKTCAPLGPTPSPTDPKPHRGSNGDTSLPDLQVKVASRSCLCQGRQCRHRQR